MQTNRTLWRGFVVMGLCAVVMGMMGGWARADEGAKEAAELWGGARGSWVVAKGGDVDAVLSRYRDMVEKTDEGQGKAEDVKLLDFGAAIEAHGQLEAERARKTEDAYRDKMTEMQKYTQDGDLTKALSSAVEAVGLTADREGFASQQSVSALIAEAEKRAAEEVKEQSWFEALALYRRMELLYENQERYTDQRKEVARHLRLVNLYAPDAWFRMKTAYAEAHGENVPKRWVGEDTMWKDRLEGVSVPMLLQTLALAQRMHVEKVSYETMMSGGLESVIELAEEGAIAETFKGLGDETKRDQFIERVTRMKKQTDERVLPMVYTEARAIVSDVLAANDETVKLPEEVVVYEFGEGVVGKLDDFSSIIWPYEKEQFDRTLKGEFSGVGIQIMLNEDDILTVVCPLEDTPAQRAGIRGGDQIVTIDGRDSSGISLNEAVNEITGDAGTAVVLGIQTPGQDAVRDVKLVRESIKIRSVKGWSLKGDGSWEYYVDPVFRIGYIRLAQFHKDSAEEMDKAVAQMRAEGGIGALILDLRFDPGGLLPTAIGVCNRFVNDGVLVSNFKEGEEREAMASGLQLWQARADEEHTYGDFPVVVLINGGSASASEIVAGCLQDHHRALILGERSYGKGSVQEPKFLSGSRAIFKVTTQYYRLPSGRIIHRRPGAENWGITPDIEVRMTDAQVTAMLKARMMLDVPAAEKKMVVDKETESQGNDAAVVQSAGLSEGTAPADPADVKPVDEPVKSTDDILERGLDPQLEMALLLLKARLIGEPQG